MSRSEQGSASQSSIATWFACPRKWRYTYIDGKESVMPPSREQAMGTAFHKLVENYLLGKPQDDVDLPSDTRATALALFDKYQELYPLASFGTIIGAEVPFQLDGIHGIFDALVTDGDWVTVVEHKTTKSDFAREAYPGSPSYWDKVQTDWQVGMYQLAARSIYHTNKVKVLYDVIRVPQLKQKKTESASEFRERIALAIAESPELYFGQAEVKWSDAKLAALREDLQDVTAQIAVAKDTARFPRSRKCYEWNRTCEFMSPCHQGGSLDDERLYQVRSRR